MQHRYIFTLEVVPLKLDHTYDALPLHLTLLSRFLTDLKYSQLQQFVKSVFEKAYEVNLLIDGTAELGPKETPVYIVRKTDEITQLHNDLCRHLDKIHVTYEYPEYVQQGYKPHISKRRGFESNNEDVLVSSRVYLVEIIDRKRVVRSRFGLGKT